MKRDLLQQHFEKTGFTAMEADALALVFEQYREEMATKQDVALLRSELTAAMAALRSELRGEMAVLRSELKGDMKALRRELKGDISSLKADLTWRFLALTAFFATVMTLVGVFVG